jgi:protein required for attachment to host cells
MKIKHNVWVVIADGSKYLLTVNKGDVFALDLRVREHETENHEATHEQGTDRPGRLPDPAGGKSAVMQADWHQIEEAKFAAELAERLRKAALKGEFDGLVLVADPRTLGNIRPHLHEEVKKRLVAEIPKDLTGEPISKIEKLLAKY